MKIIYLFWNYITDLIKEWVFWLSVIGTLFWWVVGAFFVEGVAVSQSIYWLVALAGIVIAAFRIHLRQKAHIEANMPALPKLFINPSPPAITGIGNLIHNPVVGDLTIRVPFEIRNPENDPLIFNIEAAVNYDGLLFGTEISKLNLMCPNGPRNLPPVKVKIGEKQSWTGCYLQIMLPRKFSSLEDFLQAIFSSNESEFEVILDINIETLDGTKVRCEPVSIKGNTLSALDQVLSDLERTLMHPQNLRDLQMEGVVKPLLGIVKNYYLEKLQRDSDDNES